MRSFQAWYQVLLAGTLAIIFTVPIFHARVQFDCGGTSDGITCMVWILGLISVPGVALPPSCLAPDLWKTVLLAVVNWILFGMIVITLTISIRLFRKKPCPTLAKTRTEATGGYVVLLVCGVAICILDLLAVGYSPAGLAILVPGLLIYKYSRRLYPTKVQLAEYRQRLADIGRDVAATIIAGRQDAVLAEIQDITTAAAAEFLPNGVDEMAVALYKRISSIAGIVQSLHENKSMCIASLKAAYPASDFPAMILELCQQLNLTIQGDTIQRNPASSIDLPAEPLERDRPDVHDVEGERGRQAR